MKTILVAAAAALALAAPAFAQDGIVADGCAGQSFTAGDLVITGAFTRAMLPRAKAGGAFLSIKNTGATADRLVGAATKAAAVTQIHEMKMEGEVMKMGQLPDGLEIPAGGTVDLTPGGFHVMMMGVTAPFQEGECVEMTLDFEKAGTVPVVLAVGGTAAKSAGDMSMPMGDEGAPAMQH